MTVIPTGARRRRAQWRNLLSHLDTFFAFFLPSPFDPDIFRCSTTVSVVYNLCSSETLELPLTEIGSFFKKSDKSIIALTVQDILDGDIARNWRSEREVIMAKKKARKTKSIITGHLEKIGANVFDDYSSVITDLLHGQQGIYALYKKERLYYVGLASNLKSRIKAHNKDKLQNKWTHFSLYIIRKEEHIKEIESLVLRISYPKGNSVKGKLKQSKDLRPLLKNKLVEDWKNRLDGIIGGRKKVVIKSTAKKKKAGKAERPLKGLLRGFQRIYCTYRGKEHRARVLPNGVVELLPSHKRFDSPSMAGIAVIKKKTVNGWKLWKYKEKNGNLVYIDNLRK